MAISNPGLLLNSVPASQKQTLATNYLDLSTNAGWGQQYVPDLMEKEAEVFGPRTISGFLSQVGAEEAMTADQVIWSEQGRLHLSYKGKINTNGHDAGADSGAGGTTSQLTIESDIDETTGFAPANHGIRVNDTVIVSNSDGIFKCLVTVVNGILVDVAPYGQVELVDNTASKGTTILVYGSEYGKGDSYYSKTGAADTRRVLTNQRLNLFLINQLL